MGKQEQLSIKAMKAVQMIYANSTKHDWPDDVWDAICQAIEADKQEPMVDPMDTPLPCDVTVGHVTIRKGVALRILVTRMKVLYEMATGQVKDYGEGQTD